MDDAWAFPFLAEHFLLVPAFVAVGVHASGAVAAIAAPATHTPYKCLLYSLQLDFDGHQHRYEPRPPMDLRLACGNGSAAINYMQANPTAGSRSKTEKRHVEIIQPLTISYGYGLRFTAHEVQHFVMLHEQHARRNKTQKTNNHIGISWSRP